MSYLKWTSDACCWTSHTVQFLTIDERWNSKKKHQTFQTFFVRSHTSRAIIHNVHTHDFCWWWWGDAMRGWEAHNKQFSFWYLNNWRTDGIFLLKMQHFTSKLIARCGFCTIEIHYFNDSKSSSFPTYSSDILNLHFYTFIAVFGVLFCFV